MLPGFIPRLHTELIRAIVTSPSTSARPPVKPGRLRPPAYDRYAALRPLVPHFAILNNPSPTQPSGARGGANARTPPAFTPAPLPCLYVPLPPPPLPPIPPTFLLPL